MRIGTLITGLLLVLTGVVFFLINLGYGSWVSIHEIGKFWPILLIIIGLSFLGKGRIPHWIAYLLIILSVGAVAAYMLLEEQAPLNNETISKSGLTISRQQYPAVKESNLRINYGGGQLFINPGTQDWLKADFSNKQIKQEIEARGQNLQVDLSQTQYNLTPHTQNLNRWQVELSPELTWNLDMDTGAMDGNINLYGIPLRELKCNLGAGNMVFILGNNGANSNIKMEAGASNVKLVIDEDTGVRIKLDGELNANNLDGLGWNKSDGYYISPNYQQASSKIDCDIDLSVGNLDVKMQSMR